MIKTKNAGILEAREVLRTLNLSNPLRRMYEMHLKAVRDRQAEDAYVRDLGRAEGKAEAVLELLEELEAVPEKLQKEILSQRDTDTLRTWHKAAAKATSLEEWRSICGENLG